MMRLTFIKYGGFLAAMLSGLVQIVAGDIIAGFGTIGASVSAVGLIAKAEK